MDWPLRQGLYAILATALWLFTATSPATAQVPSSSDMDATTTEALYQNYLFSQKNDLLHVGSVFPKYQFKTRERVNFDIAGKRTLLFVRGPMCGSCDKIIKQYEKSLTAQGVQVVSAITFTGQNGIANVSYGKTADATKLVPAPSGTISTGDLAETVRHPFGVGTYLIDEKSVIRYLSYGFNSADQRLGTAITTIKQPLKMPTLIPGRQALSTLKWKNQGLKKMLADAKNRKGSLVVFVSESCDACDGLQQEFQGFFADLQKKQIGVYIISNKPLAPLKNGPMVVIDTDSEWMNAFNSNFFPLFFFLKGDRYDGLLQYTKSGSDPNQLSDRALRAAILRVTESLTR
jgi:hypothetical protein